MNKRKEQIIRYLDGSMSDEEKLHFEKMLAEDPELRRETVRTGDILSEMKNAAEPDLNETYFVNMLPGFYAKHEKKKKFYFSKIAYALSTAAAVILILFIILKPSGTVNYTNLNELTKSLTANELNETLNQYADQFSISELAGSSSARVDSLVNNMVADELDLSGSVDQSVADNYLNSDELLSSLDQKEADELYSQLINVDIMKGVK